MVAKKFSFKNKIFSLPQNLTSTPTEKNSSNPVLRNNSDDQIESMEFPHEKGVVIIVVKMKLVILYSYINTIFYHSI